MDKRKNLEASLKILRASPGGTSNILRCLFCSNNEIVGAFKRGSPLYFHNHVGQALIPR